MHVIHKEEGLCNSQQQESSDSLAKDTIAVGKEESPKVMSITQAAKLYNITRQAIYVAIKHKKLKATKTTRWVISMQDLEEYRKTRYSREKSMYEGELLFDNDKGWFSVRQAASILKVPTQKIYYATRTKSLVGLRRGAAWVIHISEIEKYRQKYLNKDTSADTPQTTNS